MRVSHADGLAVGDWPAAPETTALLEAAGALLAWDVLAGTDVPAARIHDPRRAADWLWEIYGDAAAAGVLAGAREVAVPAEGEWRVRDACRTAARLDWALAWWPASATAGVPALDPVLLHAERAVALAGAEHLLDDPDAVARALVLAGPPGAAAGPAGIELAGRVAALAEEYGVEPAPAGVADRSGYALAAGGAGVGAGLPVLSGSSPVDWRLVPAGAVDAAAPAEWVVLRRRGETVVTVSVAPGPRRATALAARFGEVDVALDEVDALGRRTGSAPVPASVLLTPRGRGVVVYAPGFAGPAEPHPGAEALRAAVIAHARDRIGSPAATLTERSAR